METTLTSGAGTPATLKLQDNSEDIYDAKAEANILLNFLFKHLPANTYENMVKIIIEEQKKVEELLSPLR